MTLEERLSSLMNRIPKTVWTSHGVVESRLISFENREVKQTGYSHLLLRDCTTFRSEYGLKVDIFLIF